MTPARIPQGTLTYLSAFTTSPAGGNPAGVWIGDALPDAEAMQRMAREVGFSETAFLAPGAGPRRTVRYFSPEAEVPFCGHATIAAGVQVGALGGAGRYCFETPAGEVIVDVDTRDGLPRASLTSVEPRQLPPPPGLVDRALAALDWKSSELDPAIPPVLAFAGAWHLVLAAATRERLAALDYDYDALKELLLEAGCVTAQLVWRERVDLFHARNPFPVGGVVEDPATGAAAAALGGYLRDAGLLDVPASIVIRQGETMGRPSRLEVEIPVTGGIVVSGHAVPIGVAGKGK